ncbi:MAG: metal ABC transporter ATP-binding protein [candidate division WOR-3 bacterium]|nr:metal ABC transporter ATP-binding protein [candidate division WOR-3 bacterium]MCX7947820.1 metal ABC transporter ATP-binding protein [candidate division WOR-3 bacterium]MDW8150777.1 metal ABC transporter ATP-binding protein [candidate division WOR-3 bacterium]
MVSLRISNLTVYYDINPILIDVNLEFESGKIYGIIGPNGAGKTTLIKSILNLVKYEEGEIVFFDSMKFENVRNKVAYIPQKEVVDWDFPITVFEVVLMGRFVHLGLFKRPKKYDLEITEKALRASNIYHLRDRQISELSGGQQQKVLIARAICQEADIYLLDEPFTAIDILTEKKLTEILRNLKNHGKTIIIIDHDLSRAKTYDELVLLNRRVIAKGKPSDVLNDKNLFELYSEKLLV